MNGRRWSRSDSSAAAFFTSKLHVLASARSAAPPAASAARSFFPSVDAAGALLTPTSLTPFAQRDQQRPASQALLLPPPDPPAPAHEQARHREACQARR